jgi:hypothetical protein
MEIEITPEPSAGERAALVQALETEDRPADGYGSVWRLAGLLENVDSDDFAPRAAASGSPRSSRGASRA